MMNIDLLIRSVTGDVKYWDPRMNSSIKTYQASHAMTAMAVHSAADIFAWYVIGI